MSGRSSRIGVVGLGELGGSVATHLAGSGGSVTVADRDGDRVRSVIDTCPQQIRDGADGGVWSTGVVLCFLPDGEAIAEVLEDAVAAGRLRAPTTVVDLSTGHPRMAPGMARVLARAGASYAAAPVLRGGGDDARRGGLVLVVGGDEPDVAAIRPVLETIGTIAVQVASAAEAQVLKLVNNYVSLGVSALMAEACAVASVAGVSPDLYLRSLEAGTASSWVALSHVQAAMDRAHQPPAPTGFRAALAAKDVRYLVDLAATTGVPAPVASGIQTVYGQAIFTGHGHAEAGLWPWRWLAPASGATADST